jgi:hypothetical protein
MGDSLAVGAGVFCVLVVLLVTLASLGARRRNRRRADRLRGWARENGWTVTPHPAVNWGTRLPGGNRDGIAVAVSGRVGGRPVSVAEYLVTDAQVTSAPDGMGGTTTSTAPVDNFYVATVAVLAQPLPAITVEPRGAMSRLAHAVVGPGESATGNPAFDRAFRIRTSDPAAVPRWCTPQIIDAHLRGQIPPWSVYGAELLTYQPGRLDPAAVPGQIAPVAYLADLLDQSAAR